MGRKTRNASPCCNGRTAAHSALLLYLASSNPGKLREFREAAAHSGFEVEPVPGMQSLPSVIEDGRTFRENASKKALQYSRSIDGQDRKSTRLNSSHVSISYAVFCLKKKKYDQRIRRLLATP